MRNIIVFLLLMLSAGAPVQTFADDAARYIREAEYYQKKADSYRREAAYYLKKAESYQREAAYYTKKGNVDRAKNYQRDASRAMDDYKRQLNYAAKAEEKAADYLKRAEKATRK